MNLYNFKVLDINKQEVSLADYKGTFGNAIKWNFTKFLIDREGNAVGRFAPTVTPAKLEKEIQKYL